MQQTTANYFIGIDIGGTKCAIVIGDREFNIFKKIQFETKTERGYKAILNDFFDNLDKLFNEFPKKQIQQIGISCGGPLDSNKGIIYSPPNLPGWDSVPVVKIFQKKYGIATALQNDANACALAEWMMGAGKGTRNMIFLTFGTGMGAGLILNGQLYSGTNDLGGEVGHIRLAKTGPVGFGKAGSFEGFCSGGGIAQLAKTIVSEKISKGQNVEFCEANNIDNLDAKTVAIAANADDLVANEIVKISAGYLGKALAILIDTLNPQCIVIGSIYSRNVNLFKPHIDRILNLEAIPAAVEVCEIKPALLGDSIGDYAALCVAINEV
ncbi:MAG: ROK family protein [Prolixibacteraceae bacterium]|jgi:glucokinase|nr:ROK family protein [Prolixibacteraceae bacterium]MBT6765218.1 ROK family protein [Prolixibacteraceae bacterium]MBT6999481.1 ROK family protein [Prolixibacteraceae bacterium]MBT7395871.1 ROK family protein [Prolixibacteraceae bacterium]